MAKRASRLTRLARRCLRALPEASAGVVVAVSGGADSVAVLHAIDEARDSDALVPLIVAHLNHQLRGEESNLDEAFVAALHAQLVTAGRPNLTLVQTRLDVAGLARAEGENLEAVARRERYRWLAEVARASGARWIATGHTANDQAETVLHRLMRGTGLRGLRGIAARRPLGTGLSVVRPLLQATRAEILDYLHGLSQPYREDASNRDPRFTRNRIRHELLPLLARDYNPAIVDVLARLARQADDVYRFEETAARALLAEAERPRAGDRLVFDHRALLAAPRHSVREMFRQVWDREGWPVGRMDHAAWERLADVALGVLNAVDLPGGLHARRRERVVQIGHSPQKE
jgi:tRNA(Ile)-lysidine synthase